MVKVYVKQCDYDPTPLLGKPIGMFHCPKCWCMVVAGVSHGYCIIGICGTYECDNRPKEEIEVSEEEYEMIGYELSGTTTHASNVHTDE